MLQQSRHPKARVFSFGIGSSVNRFLLDKMAEALLEHDEVKAMMSELQQSETDDDQDLDEFFEDMMQTVRAHFLAEERDMFPLMEGSPSPQAE